MRTTCKIGFTNVGYIVNISFLPLHLETAARGITVLLVLFWLFLVYRATRRNTIKKAYQCCFRKRHKNVLEGRNQKEGMELRTISRNISRNNLPDVVLSHSSDETITDLIRCTANELNLLEVARNATGQRQGETGLETGCLPPTKGAGECCCDGRGRCCLMNSGGQKNNQTMGNKGQN